MLTELKNEAQFIEFEEDYEVFTKEKPYHCKYYAIRYQNLKNAMNAFWMVDVYDFNYRLKAKGWLREDQCVSVDASSSEINDWIKLIAREELNIQSVLDVEKLQRGYTQVREELEQKTSDMDQLTLDFAEISMELIRTKVRLVTANKENRLVVSKI